jgi:glucose-6-phosphate 1-epimerase
VSAQKLNATFGIPSVLRFEETDSGLVLARIATCSAHATVFLQGAHITHWQSADECPVLFTGACNRFLPGEAIRGGIPLVFPWFGSYSGDLPAGRRHGLHGFARTAPWTLLSVGLSGCDCQLTFALQADEQSRTLGFDCFRLEYTLRIGRSLQLELAVHNLGAETLRFEEGFHIYFAIEDIGRTSLSGLSGAAYLDGADGFKQKRQTDAELRFPRRTDSIYLGTDATCELRDEGNKRLIFIEKSGSRTTVVWNPGSETAAAICGLGPCDCRKFLCVETANARSDAIALAPGATHNLATKITVQRDQNPCSS